MWCLTGTTRASVSAGIMSRLLKSITVGGCQGNNPPQKNVCIQLVDFSVGDSSVRSISFKNLLTSLEKLIRATSMQNEELGLLLPLSRIPSAHKTTHARYISGICLPRRYSALETCCDRLWPVFSHLMIFPRAGDHTKSSNALGELAQGYSYGRKGRAWRIQ